VITNNPDKKLNFDLRNLQVLNKTDSSNPDVQKINERSLYIIVGGLVCFSIIIIFTSILCCLYAKRSQRFEEQKKKVLILDKKAIKGVKRTAKVMPKVAKFFPRSTKNLVKHDNQYEDVKKINAEIPKH